MDDLMPPPPGLSPVGGKLVVAHFDGACLSSDAGVLVLREIEQRLGVAERLAGCIDDPRAQAQVVHGLAEMIRFRMLMIASGYEDGNDATTMRSDPAFKLAQDVLPSAPDLASQPTLSRLENWPDLRALLRMGKALVDLYCASYARVPKRIVLDFDDTFDAVHGGQQLRLFNAHYDEYGFQPVVVFDGDGRFVTAMLRPAKRPTAWKYTSSFSVCSGQFGPTDRPRTFSFAPTATIVAPRSSTSAVRMASTSSSALRRPRPCAVMSKRSRRAPKGRFEAGAKKAKVRRFKKFNDGAASWSRVERIIARVEAGEEGADGRFIVTNLAGGKPKTLYEDIYCRRGCAENHIKSWKTHLAEHRNHDPAGRHHRAP